VGEGLGVAMVPNSMQAMHLETTVFKPIINAPVVEVAVVWNKDNRNPCIQTFVDTAEEVWAGLQQAQSANVVTTAAAPTRRRATTSSPKN
jgi:DNA-binding transcriptional LysR family regulator